VIVIFLFFFLLFPFDFIFCGFPLPFYCPGILEQMGVSGYGFLFLFLFFTYFVWSIPFHNLFRFFDAEFHKPFKRTNSHRRRIPRVSSFLFSSPGGTRECKKIGRGPPEIV